MNGSSVVGSQLGGMFIVDGRCKFLRFLHMVSFLDIQFFNGGLLDLMWRIGQVVFDNGETVGGVGCECA